MHRATGSVDATDDRMIRGLMRPDAFDHPVEDVELVETHISWLIFAGEFVYKLKKPLKLDFLDFSDLEQRRYYCEEEVRLNRPWAPEIYVEVVPVTLTDGQPGFGGQGAAVEWAVKMRRFDPACTLDRQLDAGRLSVDDVRQLANHVADRHEQAPRAPASARARVLALAESFMWDNFDVLDGHVDAALVGELRDWTRQELERRRAMLAKRFDDGYVRDCHGDLHLGNLVRLESGITTFDCIEFDEDLRQIDTMCDLGFLVMDLHARDRADLASQCLDRYLEVTGDHGGLSVLRLFVVYRSLVRAKVEVIRSQEREATADAHDDRLQAASHCALAARIATHDRPGLVLMHGLSGTGKTWVSGRLLSALPAVRVRSDVERKRLFGIDETASSESAPGEGLYDEESNRQVYEHLVGVATSIIDAGYHAIVDAAFLHEHERRRFVELGNERGVTTVIVDVTADREIIEARLRQRGAQGRDASEAGSDVLAFQARVHEPLTESERAVSVTCDNSVSIDVEKIVTSILMLASAGRSGQ